MHSSRLVARPDWLRDGDLAASLYAADFSKLGEQVSRLLRAGATLFHFDVGDGRFIPDITMGPVVLRGIAPLIHRGGGKVGCHLMVEEPARHLEALAKAGADGASFHLEACADPSSLIRVSKSLGLVTGLAFSPETPVERAVQEGRDADHFLCLSVHPGFSGQAIVPEAYARIARLRALQPSAFIVVDGGVTGATIEEIRRAGANLLVAGSAIFWAEDPAAAYLELRARISGHDC